MLNPLQTPHSEYHWDGSNNRFFEGWYFRVTLPMSCQQWSIVKKNRVAVTATRRILLFAQISLTV